MIPISIDMSGVVDEFNLSQDDANKMIDFVMTTITDTFADNWDREAAATLSKSRTLYQRNIVKGQVNQTTKYVQLTGVVPNMIESGASAFDMKVGFKNSSKVKYTKQGNWYLTIPLRFGVPTTIGESQSFATRNMPQAVYAIAKSLKPKQTAPGGNSTQGQQIKQSGIPKRFAAPLTRPTIKDNVGDLTKQQAAAYTHKFSIYAGMQRNQKTYEKATQGSYNTFRRAGALSDVNSWIHQGISARNLADKALQNTNIEYEVDKATDGYLASLGFEV